MSADVEKVRDALNHEPDEADGEALAALDRIQAQRDREVEALNLALMHLEDERAIAAVRAVLAEQEKEQPS